MPATTQVEIINIALGHLKQRPITAITDLSVQAQVANLYYESARKETLRGHDWSFATVAEDLALVANYTPTDNWFYAYAYPANCLALWHVYNNGTVNKTSGDDFRVLYDPTNGQKVVVSNTEDGIGEYTYDLSDTSMYDANFVTAFAYRLAADMAPQLTGDDNVAKGFIALFNNAISEAERFSAYENTQVKEATRSSYEDAR